MRWFQGLLTVGKDIAANYVSDRVPRMAAALSYYTVFSLAPLLVIAIFIAGVFFGHAAASGGISNQMRTLLGDTGAAAIQSIVANAWHGSGGWASVLGVITLLIGATGVFGELQDSLNSIWGVAPRPGHGLWYFIRARILSFTMILVIGFLMLVSLTLSAMVAGIGAWIAHELPALSTIIGIANVSLLFVISTLLFALIFKLLPDVELRWGDVWIGAVVTSVCFALGRWAIGLYLGHSAVASSYGAAGSLAVLLIWVYFSAQAFLIGAEFTKAFARTFGSHIAPKAIAQWNQSPPAPAAPRADHSGQSGSLASS